MRAERNALDPMPYDALTIAPRDRSVSRLAAAKLAARPRPNVLLRAP